MITNLFIFTVGMVVLMTAIDFIFSKKRLRLGSTIAFVGYGLLIGLPVFFSAIYGLANVDVRSRLIYIAIVIIVLLPSLGRMWWYAIKRRVPFYQPAFINLAILGPVAVPLFPPGYHSFPMLITLVFLVFFFYYLWKFPYMNDSWIVNLVHDTAKAFQTKGRYSGKPITIKKGINKRFYVSSGGISLMFRENHAICQMSRSTHRKLGEPNLEKLFEKVVSEIISYEEKIKKA